MVALSRALLAGTLKTIFFFVLLFMLTAFISMDAPRIVRFTESLVPATWRPDLRRLLHGIDAGLAGVVRGQLTIMLVNGVLTLVGLLVLRIPFAFALSALATLLYVVPIFGTILSSIPIVLLATTAGGLSKGLLALGWILVIHALEAYVLNPKIMGDAARIHPVLIVLALVIGERSLGIVGALLAVPLASVVVAVFRFLQRKLAELEERAAAHAPALRPLHRTRPRSAAAHERNPHENPPSPSPPRSPSRPPARAPPTRPPRSRPRAAPPAAPRRAEGRLARRDREGALRVGLAVANSLEVFSLLAGGAREVLRGIRDGWRRQAEGAARREAAGSR